MMSPKDLCTLDFLDQVIDTGVKVLKIEGRGRAPEYVAKVIKTYHEAIDAHYEGTFSKEKVQTWMEELEKVYNRGFWSGYYLGQKLGMNGAKPMALRPPKRKSTLERGCTTSQNQHRGFKIEAYDLKIGDTVLITGPSTGVQEFELTEMMVNDQQLDAATKGDSITIPLDFRIRQSDKLYKIVKTEYAVETSKA